MERPTAPVVAQVSFAGQDDLNRLAGELDVWQVDHAMRRATLLLTPAQLQQLRSTGRPLTVDAAATARLAWPTSTVSSPLPERIPNFPCYRTVEETYTSLAQLAEAAPDLVQPVSLGQSWQSVQTSGGAGYPIEGVILTNQALPGTKPILF